MEQRNTRHGHAYEPSRTSSFVGQIASVLSEIAGGAKIDYDRFLSIKAPTRCEPVNAVDYFYIALFSYFVSKGQRTTACCPNSRVC
jgi:hypothetical protein